MRFLATCFLIAAVLGGCGGGSSHADVNPAPDGIAGDAADVGSAESVGSDLGAGDTATAEGIGADSTTDASDAPFPLDPTQRGQVELRGIIHLHSALSHDGCAPDGYEDNGGPDPDCLAELRAAPCASGIDFMMMTDHPGHLKDHSYLEGIQHQEGDEVAKDKDGKPFANRITCPEGSLVPHTWVYYGTEGSKNMPVGVSGPDVPPEIYSVSYGDSTPLEEVQAAVAKAHELDGIALAVHTEESNISAERIAAVPLDGMEVYNLHANLMAALENLDTLFKLDKFLAGAEGGPASDLSVMLFLDQVDKSVEKFDWVSARVRLASVVASDIHRNVEIPALCPGGIEGSVCEGFAKDYPNFATFAMKGGAVTLADGDRMDSWGRGLRWFSNRFRSASTDPWDIREAVRAGRGYACFEVFGYPGGFDFYVVNGGKLLEMGEEAKLDGEAVAWFRVPELSAAPWMEAGSLPFNMGQVTTKLVRATEEGSEVIAEIKGQGGIVSATLPGPGAYSLRITVMPLHLKPLLPGLENLASKTFPYIYSNAVFLR